MSCSPCLRQAGNPSSGIQGRNCCISDLPTWIPAQHIAGKTPLFPLDIIILFSNSFDTTTRFAKVQYLRAYLFSITKSTSLRLPNWSPTFKGCEQDVWNWRFCKRLPSTSYINANVFDVNRFSPAFFASMSKSLTAIQPQAKTCFYYKFFIINHL